MEKEKDKKGHGVAQVGGFLQRLKKKAQNKFRGGDDGNGGVTAEEKSVKKKDNQKQTQARRKKNTATNTPKESKSDDTASSMVMKKKDRERDKDKEKESGLDASRSVKKKNHKKKAPNANVTVMKVVETETQIKEVPETVTDKFNFIPTMLNKELSGIRKEFNDIKAEDKAKVHMAMACQDPANADKNRYKNILCLDASRVRLSDGGYYHASAVDSRFILAQSPMFNTTAQFWDLVQNEGVEMIVQLHPCDEGRKCARYYPGKVGETNDFGVFKVANCRIDASPVEEPTLHFSHLKVSGPKGEQKVKHVFWSNFPPVGFPEPSNTMPFLWKQIKGHRKVLVHCSSGAGRSAVLVFTCQILERIQHGEEADAPRMLRNLREKRHCAIRNEMQYVYVMRIILFYFMKYNAVEMSQNLLIFVDDFDTYAKKFEREEKERKEKCPIPEATEPTDEFQN
ncbi:unnamed protein product [Bursaphelenchus xylophilus]|nr:unnamed protein product [Bursaphelenchus xylophilus]CAG9099012.1 unnamed protein product [Bursaphelenchus xylophilus]